LASVIERDREVLVEIEGIPFGLPSLASVRSDFVMASHMKFKNRTVKRGGNIEIGYLLSNYVF
jgi:hypothetical protein